MGSITVPNPHWVRSTGPQRKAETALEVRYAHISVPFFARKNPITDQWEMAAPERSRGHRAYRIIERTREGLETPGPNVGVTFKRAEPKRRRNEYCGCGKGFSHKVKEHDAVMAGNVPRMRANPAPRVRWAA